MGSNIAEEMLDGSYPGWVVGIHTGTGRMEQEVENGGKAPGIFLWKGVAMVV
jgi:hypothetical protein